MKELELLFNNIKNKIATTDMNFIGFSSKYCLELKGVKETFFLTLIFDGTAKPSIRLDDKEPEGGFYYKMTIPLEDFLNTFRTNSFETIHQKYMLNSKDIVGIDQQNNSFFAFLKKNLFHVMEAPPQDLEQITVEID